MALSVCPVASFAAALGMGEGRATQAESTIPRPPSLRLEAVMGRKAVIRRGDERLVLSAGETRAGLRLLQLDGEVAVVSDHEGPRQRLRLGDGPIHTRFARQQRARVSIAPNHAGMYETPGAINGRPVLFLVDTGASAVAMNAARAKALGIDYFLDGRPILVNTASGQEPAYEVQLREVQVGGIRAQHVSAVVLQGGYPREVLLGMSFLGRVDIRHDGVLMELRQKH